VALLFLGELTGDFFPLAIRVAEVPWVISPIVVEVEGVPWVNRSTEVPRIESRAGAPPARRGFVP
jgi:hypothetical protein